jgi:hypothetical protein
MIQLVKQTPEILVYYTVLYNVSALITGTLIRTTNVNLSTAVLYEKLSISTSSVVINPTLFAGRELYCCFIICF